MNIAIMFHGVQVICMLSFSQTHIMAHLKPQRYQHQLEVLHALQGSGQVSVEKDAQQVLTRKIRNQLSKSQNPDPNLKASNLKKIDTVKMIKKKLIFDLDDWRGLLTLVT